MFKIYGDYGYTTETLLEQFDSQSEAVRWAKDYAESGDFGGYSIIEVAYFVNDEYETVIRFDAEDYEDDSVFWLDRDDDNAMEWEF